MEKIKTIARELGVDRKTIKRWRRQIDSFGEFVRRRGPEVDWNALVLYRELSRLGFNGTYQQVQRFVQPYRSQSRWEQLATVCFETGPGEQA